MQVWDLSSGYLNDEELKAQRLQVQQLLAGRAEATESEPARRWLRCLNALRCVDAWLGAEWQLRGLPALPDLAQTQLAPLNLVWPRLPAVQQCLDSLTTQARTAGRIPVPRSTQGLWSQHKYSVAARSMEAYRAISVRAAASRGMDNFDEVAETIVQQLRQRPARDSLRDALLQMWGYVAASGSPERGLFDNLPRLFAEIQRRAQAESNHYLLHATALSELSVWLESPAP